MSQTSPMTETDTDQALVLLVDRFAKRLLAKLRLAHANGRRGWEKDDWESALADTSTDWAEVTDGTTLPGDRFSYIPNPETGVGQITSHKRRVPVSSPVRPDGADDLEHLDGMLDDRERG